MSKITIVDLEVYYRVGVTDQERAQPQRLLVLRRRERLVPAADVRQLLGQHPLVREQAAVGGATVFALPVERFEEL